MNPQVPFFKRFNWVNIGFLSGTPIATVALMPAYLHSHGLSLWNVLLFVIYSMISSLSITAGYHRYFAHRSYGAKPVVKFLYLLFGSAAFQGSALQWSSDHRRHHRYVDTDRDPHNIKRGFFYAHMGWLCLREYSPDAMIVPPDLVKDPMIAFQDKYYVPIAILAGFGFPMIVGGLFGSVLGGLIFGGLLRVVATNHCTFLINSLAHTLGKRTYSDQTARDSVVMAFLAYGEGYHNFHHAFAADYRNGIRWYHWDPTKWLIRTMAFFGWTFRLKSISPVQILKARLQMEQRMLEQRGAPSEYLAPFKLKVEEAQRRVRQLREDYHRMKRGVEERSRLRLQLMKYELKSARSEFKLAWAQWGAIRKSWRPAAVIAR